MVTVVLPVESRIELFSYVMPLGRDGNVKYIHIVVFSSDVAVSSKANRY